MAHEPANIPRTSQATVARAASRWQSLPGALAIVARCSGIRARTQGKTVPSKPRSRTAWPAPKSQRTGSSATVYLRSDVGDFLGPSALPHEAPRALRKLPGWPPGPIPRNLRPFCRPREAPPRSPPGRSLKNTSDSEGLRRRRSRPRTLRAVREPSRLPPLASPTPPPARSTTRPGGSREADAGFGTQPHRNRLVSRRRSRPRSGARRLKG